MTRVVVALLLVAIGPGNLRADEKTDRLQAELDKAKKELEALRKKNAELEERLAAELEKSRLLATADEWMPAHKVANREFAEAAKLLEKLRTLAVPQAPPPRPKGERQPAPLPEGTRGVVTDVAGELVTVNIGADVGLERGSALDVYRVDGNEKRYLGTVKVTSALNLFPKQAIVTFTPARNVPLDKLRPEELPKKGDQVRPPEAVRGTKP